MHAHQRIEIIQTRLNQAFNPDVLQIKDDSAKHIGHAGNAGGGHYTIIISSPYLKSLSRLAAHRAVYSKLQDLIPQEIHALSIKMPE